MENKVKPSLLLLPGTLCTEALFAPQFTALAEVADVCIRPLLKGKTVAACAAATLQDVPGRFALVGHSQGGLVALEIMRQAPERVSRLCLISTNPRGSTEQNLETWARWQREARAGGFTEIVRFYLDHVADKEGREKVQAVVTAMAQATGPETFLSQLEMLKSRTDSCPTLRKISCPTLLLGGEQDRVTPPELQREMARLVPHANSTELAACGHYAPLERPRRVAAALCTWLSNEAGNGICRVADA